MTSRSPERRRRHDSRSRSPARHSHPHSHSHRSRSPRRHDERRHRSRSPGRERRPRSPERERERERERRRSRSRSRERHRSPHRSHHSHHHHSNHHSSSRNTSSLHSDRDGRSHVKLEREDKRALRQAAAIFSVPATNGALKSEEMKEQPASSFPPRVGPSLPPPVAKLENEPSEAEITAALEAAAAAAAGGATQPASASAAAGAAPRAAEPAAPPPKQEINYALSGRLAQAAQPTTLPGTTNVGYSEPPDARLPDDHWRLYVFKDGSVLGDPLSLHRKSCYMFGRDENAVDIHVAHPSCSKQHAVIQFRLREVQLPDGQLDHVVKPYLMDLGSTNGTRLMGTKREARRYYELLPNDLIQFGFSTREYVLINASKATEATKKKFGFS